MGTDTKMVLSQVAVVAQDLERWVVGESLSSQLAVEGCSPSAHQLPMCLAVVPDVIQCQEGKFDFTTTSAQAAVGLDRLHLQLGAFITLFGCVLFATGHTLHMLVSKSQRRAASLATMLGLASGVVFGGLAKQVLQTLRAPSRLRIWWHRRSTTRAESGFFQSLDTFALRLFGCHTYIVSYWGPNNQGGGSLLWP